MKAPTCDDESRRKRAEDAAAHLASLTDLRGKRVLEIGPMMGDFARVLVEKYDCSVVGIDMMSHDCWPDVIRPIRRSAIRGRPCARSSGKHFIRANLYRSSIASHLYKRLSDPWPHLMYSPEELRVRLKAQELGWAFWVNKLIYQQYLYYFRQLGFYITYEKFIQTHFDYDYYEDHEKWLGFYPQWDLKTDFFEVLLEFDPKKPKVPIPDPVYSRMRNRG